jgi:hypothetical protein
MSSRGSQLLGVVVALFVGFLGAYVAHNLRTSPVKPGVVANVTTPSPSAEASSAPSAAPSAVPSTAPSTAPTEAPSPSPSQAAASPTPTQSAGPAAYPAQIQAGGSYAMSAANNSLFALASDGVDGGSSACAGINESTQAFPAGYEGSFFVLVNFPDGAKLYAGYLRFGGGARQDFAEYQKGGRTYPAGGPAGAATASGSHTYCVTHGSGGWSMTDDGAAIPCPGCPAEAATDIAGATVMFESSAQYFSGTRTALTLTVPGFHDLLVGGAAPRQLRGRTQYA